MFSFPPDFLIDVLSFVMIALGSFAIFTRWQLRQTREALEAAQLRLTILEEQRGMMGSGEVTGESRMARLEEQIDRLAEGQDFLARVVSDRLTSAEERARQVSPPNG